MVEERDNKYFEELASESFKNIKKTILGLIDILNITLSDNGNEMFYDLALDNVKKLSQNILELVLNEEGLASYIKQGKLANFEIKIPSKEYLQPEIKNPDKNPKKIF